MIVDRGRYGEPTVMRGASWAVAALTVTTLFFGCATLPSPLGLHSMNEVRFRDRAEAAFDDEVRVTAAVPSAEENKVLFGVDLSEKEIQPIWVKVENHSDHTYYLLSVAADPNYFSPMEAAYAVRGGFSKSAKQELEDHFRAMSFRNPILANTAVSGFIFTNLDEGEKVVQADLIANEKIKSFTFFVQIPDMRVDYRMVDFETLYDDEEIVELTLDELRLALENLPCCTTDKDGTLLGDPLNLIIVGDFVDVAAAFTRRGWLPTEETYSTAVLKTIKSYFFGRRYRYSPISSLYYGGRHQDLARQKPRHDIHERNHLRLWYSPMRFEGKPVFVGQVSRDVGVRFTTKAWPPVTHKIDPDIDEARHAVAEDLLFSQSIDKVAFVKGVGSVTPSRPRRNLSDDIYFTDGLRLVLFLDHGPIPLNQMKYINWEQPRTFHVRD